MVMEEEKKLTKIYRSARKLHMRARDCLDRLDQPVNHSLTSLSSSSSSSLYNHNFDTNELPFIEQDIFEMQSLCVEMEQLLPSLISNPNHNIWNRRKELVAEEVDSLEECLEKHLHRKRQIMQQKVHDTSYISGDSRHSDVMVTRIQKQLHGDKLIKYMMRVLITVIIIIVMVLTR